MWIRYSTCSTVLVSRQMTFQWGEIFFFFFIQKADWNKEIACWFMNLLHLDQSKVENDPISKDYDILKLSIVLASFLSVIMTQRNCWDSNCWDLATWWYCSSQPRNTSHKSESDTQVLNKAMLKLFNISDIDTTVLQTSFTEEKQLSC